MVVYPCPWASRAAVLMYSWASGNGCSAGGKVAQKQEDREDQREGPKTAQNDDTKWVVGVDLCQRPS